ncbi:GNAT family N-acetyltransferase [Arthrobacter tumbae]|uniref:GNAT family N-acetyltransferase n=1 Tax=Arthrobacter tumbae TaxID=163874 RepID=UPI00195F157C|nr:GNAT family N-acetyltransferase [Arthrobacter tumbae]MBM7781859.1 RimJ/RimL family protein N-acetyltransferase [Arthrobacter tumbae]
MPTLGPYLPPRTLNQTEQPTLAVDGLLLRPWADADVATVIEAYTDPEIARFNRRVIETETEALEWIHRWPARWQKETGANWAVCKSERKVVGRVSLSLVNLFEGDAELGYWVLPSARGNGVAPLAVTALRRWAFDIVGLKRLQLTHSVRNQASCRVADKSGFAQEGTKRSAMRHDDGWHDMHLHAAINEAVA